MLQNEVGVRSEPPMSLPRCCDAAAGPTRAAATDIGLAVVPKASLNVCEPAPNSGHWSSRLR